MSSVQLSPKLRELVVALDTVTLDGRSAIGQLIDDLRTVIDIECLACVSPVETASGWSVERLDATGFSNDSRFRQLVVAYLERAPRKYGAFEPVRPEPDQRNRVVDVQDLLGRAAFCALPGYRAVLEPLRLHRHHCVRMLICDGASLLGWFGGFQPGPLAAEQSAAIIALQPALKRRLAIERKLQSTPIVAAALQAVLEQLGTAAFVIDGSGRIFETNQAGRMLLEGRRREVSNALRCAIAGEPSGLRFELTPLASRGTERHMLALVSAEGSATRIGQAMARATARLKLTRRQRDVLKLLIAGESNTAIAKALGITERAVEQHVSAMFDRAAVDSRAALVARVLLES